MRIVKLFIVFSTITVFFAQHIHAQAGERWDLRTAVEFALKNNISIRQQDVQAKIAQLTYKQSDLSKYPNLNFNANVGINTGRSIDRTTNLFTTESILYNSFSLQSNVDIFNWFSKRNTIAANRFEAQASLANVEKLKNDISLWLWLTYYGLSSFCSSS